MDIADNFMKSFFAAHPEARNGELSMEELIELLDSHQGKINSQGLDDFDGLSPQQMNDLLYSPFAPGSMIQFREGLDAYVGDVPLFKLSELLLREIQRAGKIKLTQKGNLPRGICKMLQEQNLIHWSYMEYVKQIQEDTVPYIWPLKQYLIDAGMVKKRNNALSLTKKGEKLLDGPAASRFIQLFKYMAMRFPWDYFFQIEDGGRSGQLGWAYSLVLLSKYGDNVQPSEFYSLKLIRAFENELWDGHQHDEAASAYHHAYEARFFECFAHWFGLVNIERKRDYSISFFDLLSFARSELFDKLIEVKA